LSEFVQLTGFDILKLAARAVFTRLETKLLKQGLLEYPRLPRVKVDFVLEVFP